MKLSRAVWYMAASALGFSIMSLLVKVASPRLPTGEIVTSMATSSGVRDAAGLWQSHQARRLFAYTKTVGGRIAAAEFMNEPTLR